MAWVNYHSHSDFCDGKAAMEEFIRVAVEKKFPAYGFSSHAPVPFVTRWNMPETRIGDYFRVISRLKKKYEGIIQLYAGMEIDYIEGEWGSNHALLKDLPLDYFIGSIHFIGRLSDQSHFCFDGGQPEAFFRGIDEVFGSDYKKAIIRYYELLRQMVSQNKPDVVGHMDKIKMHNHLGGYLNEEDGWYIEQVEQCLDLIASEGIIVEVNTRGLYKNDPARLYPSAWICKRILAKKIPVMLNSDSHQPQEMDGGFAQAASLLKDIGFRTLRVLWNGRWQDTAFDENGINL